ncbi:MAG: hypothetical protein ACREOC_10345 [Gemmatimonadales bacterium]
MSYPPRVAAAALLALACGGDGLLLPGDGQPAALAVVAGNNQNAQVGAPLGDPVVVGVTDATGRPVAGARVGFQVTSAAGGELLPAVAVTDNAGQASARWSLGTDAGAQTAEARVEGSDVPPLELTAFAAAGIPARLEPVRGDDQTAPVGTMLADSLVVQATDAAGNPVEGVGVSWTASSGGSVSAPAVATGVDGRAGVRRTLGPSAGDQTTVAAAAGVPGSSVVFSATATTGAAGKLTVVTQPSAAAANGQPLSEQPRVQLVDAFNNPVADAGVAVTVAIDGDARGAELAGQLTVPTDATGSAAFNGLALTGPPGTYSLRFTGASLASVVSRSIALGAGPVSPQRSSLSAAPAQIVVIGGIATLTVTLRDEFDFPAQGVTVVPSASPDGASFAPATAISDAAGGATFTFSAALPGEYRLSARAGSVPLESIAEISVTKAGTTTAIVSDAPDPSSLLAPLAVAFSVTSLVGATPEGTVTVQEVEGSGSCTAPATAGSCEIRFGGLGSERSSPPSMVTRFTSRARHRPSHIRCSCCRPSPFGAAAG